MRSIINILVFLSIFGLVYAEINSNTDLNNDDVETGRQRDRHRNRIKHHFPWKILFFHVAHGAVIALVVVKIVLAMTFVGMLSALIKMFAAFKYLFKDANITKAKEQAPKIIIPPYHHSHETEYAFPGSPPEYGIYNRRREDYKNKPSQEWLNAYYRSRLSNNYKGYGSYGSGLRPDLIAGGRNLGDNLAYAAQINERDNEKKIEELKEILNRDDSNMKRRITRSTEVDENCMKRRICLLHARANEDPIYTFQLFFIQKDGLAQYWDHDPTKTAKDCINSFPCGSGGKITEKETQKSTTTQKNKTANNINDSNESNDVNESSSEEDASPDDSPKSDFENSIES